MYCILYIIQRHVYIVKCLHQLQQPSCVILCVLCSTILILWCLSESYLRHRFISAFYCTYAARCRSCDPPKSHSEALVACLETILINPENARPWASLDTSVTEINDVHIPRHYTMKIYRKCIYICFHSIPHIRAPEILLRWNMIYDNSVF
jgi:hypothetical protein